MSTATVTMEYAEFQELQNKRKEAEEEVAALKAQITEAKIKASDPHLLALARGALDVVRYAVASLPPESHRGWPFESLTQVADHVIFMPDATPDHTELAMTLRTFATECKVHEHRRSLHAAVKQQSIDPVPFK